MKSKRVWISSPRHTEPTLLEKTFVGDGALVERLVDQVVHSTTTPNKHYSVIAGGVGIGKSHLLALVCRRVQDLALSDLAVAWLPDDAGGLMTELQLFEAILRALGEAPATDSTDSTERGRDAALTAARARLGTVLAGRTLLLCIDSLDQVLAALGETGQRGLRAFLQEDRCCTVLATARVLTRDFTDQKRPFFGFFGVHRLEEMDAAATIKLLCAHARVRGDAELVTALKHTNHRPTLLALHHILGGRPSRYVDVVRDVTELSNPEAILLRALDEDARWQRVHREQLSPQQRSILHWLSGQRGAVQVKHVAHARLISEQTVSPQLRFLRAAGLVSSTRIGRETWYEVQDPLTGIDSEYAVELFEFLRRWFVDHDAALQLDTNVATRLRVAVAETDPGDPRNALGLPQLERRLVATSFPSRVL